MSNLNAGSQTVIFDFRYPLKGATFNRLQRSTQRPGVYKGMTLSFSGNQVFIEPGVIYVNCIFDGRDNVGVKIDFDTITVLDGVLQSEPGSNDLIYITYEYAEITEDFADFHIISTNSWLANPDLNGVVIGEIVYDSSPPFDIEGIDLKYKTWGIINADAEHSIPDEVVNSNTEDYDKKWTVKGIDLSVGKTELSYQQLDELEARIPLTNGSNTTEIENDLSAVGYINGIKRKNTIISNNASKTLTDIFNNEESAIYKFSIDTSKDIYGYVYFTDSSNYELFGSKGTVTPVQGNSGTLNIFISSGKLIFENKTGSIITLALYKEIIN